MALEPLVSIVGDVELDDNGNVISYGRTIFEFPEPASYDSTTSTIVDSTRNSKGVMIGDVVRDSIAKVELSWKLLSLDKWAEMIQYFKEGGQDGDGAFEQYIRFLDQESGKYVVRLMYINDRKAGMWRRNHETGAVMGWENCKLNLIEV